MAVPGGRPPEGFAVDQPLVVAFIVTAVVGLAAATAILRGNRPAPADGPAESPLAASTEGETVCLACGMGNLWTDRTCVSCGASLAG